MADSENPMFTTAQVFKMLADSMEYSSEAIREAGSLVEAQTILKARAAGARELADGMSS